MTPDILRHLLTGLALCTALASPVLADGDDPAPNEVVDPMPGGDDGTMWAGGDPDFCEACGGEVVDTVDEGGEEGGTITAEPTALNDGVANVRGATTKAHDSDGCAANRQAVLCKDN
ncbi:hypothetical protein [Gemmobacter caeruleus]|uniref:hypothetical protein n=1 Tax=Gemmobacter caeruleus TaxID=2595004 RepID=UPI0011EE4A0A|nr:hypothetical protein [Gemmobacter caeruleus]